MHLYKQPRSPFYSFDARINGKRKRVSTKETSPRAAEKVAASYMLRMGAGESLTRSRKIPTLQEFSERFFARADNTSTLEPNNTIAMVGACSPSQTFPISRSIKSTRR